MGIRYSKEYEINYYDVNYKLEANITTLINYIGDIGTAQTEGLGIGMEYLTANNMAWVFYQYDIKVNRYPKYGEKVKLVTNPAGFKKFYALRTYELFDESGEKILEAQAIFFLINIEKRKAMRVPEEQCISYGAIGDENIDFKVERLEKLKEVMYSKEFNVRYSDIDSNRHVNNSKYVEWAIEAVPLEIVKDYSLNRIRITFDKECTYGHKVTSSVECREEEDKIVALHKIENEENINLTTIITEWKKIN